MSASRIRMFEYIPEPIRKAFAGAEPPDSPEQLLEREVVARAVLDACGYSGEPVAGKHNAIVQEARSWFKNGKNVEAVFDNAGIVIDDARSPILNKPARLQRRNSRRRKEDYGDDI